MDPGEATITKLNDVADLTAFNQEREPPGEFQSWVRRPALWNFSLEDLLPPSPAFTFSPAAQAWLPPAYQLNLITTFLATLLPGDPVPGTWGIGPWDLYHCHVVTTLDPATGRPADPDADLAARSLHNLDQSIDPFRTLRNATTTTDPADFAAYAADFAAIHAKLMVRLDDIAATGIASLFYHSFESSAMFPNGSRYQGYQPGDGRRNWLTSLPGGLPRRTTSTANPTQPIKDFFDVIQLQFLVDKGGVIHVVASSKVELVTITRRPYAEIAG